MNRDLGYIRKVRGRFHWPFNYMEEGDFFHVLWEDAHSDRVRNSVWKLAKDKGLHISVLQCEEGTKVIALPREVGETRSRPRVSAWQIVKPELESAGVDGVSFPWRSMAVGEARVIEREGERGAPIVTQIEERSFLIESEASRLRIARLPNGMHLHSWARAKAEARLLLADE